MADKQMQVVRELAEILKETDLTEIEYEHGDLKVMVARNPRGQVLATPAPLAAPAVAAPAPAAPAAEGAAPAAAPANAVKAPMVGVAYFAPEPGSAPYVKVGDTVSEGQTLLLIEAMKTFNPVPAPRSGKVTAIYIEDGMPVEYDEPLLTIE